MYIQATDRSSNNVVIFILFSDSFLPSGSAPLKDISNLFQLDFSTLIRITIVTIVQTLLLLSLDKCNSSLFFFKLINIHCYDILTWPDFSAFHLGNEIVHSHSSDGGFLLHFARRSVSSSYPRLYRAEAYIQTRGIIYDWFMRMKLYYFVNHEVHLVTGDVGVTYWILLLLFIHRKLVVRYCVGISAWLYSYIFNHHEVVY